MPFFIAGVMARILPVPAAFHPRRFLTMKRALWIVPALAVFLGEATPAAADLIASHQGTTNPTSEGFGVYSGYSSTTTGPLANDQGLPAWRVTGTGQDSEFGYGSPALTTSQRAEIASQGFTLTMVARVLPNLAPAYTTSDPVVIAGGLVGYAGVLWDIALGLNSNGDTVVVLPNAHDNSGPGGSIRAFGPSYTLTGSGSTYHTYQLFYNPITHYADVSVDGAVVLTGYTGDTTYYNDNALRFGADSGGQGNFSSLQVQIGEVSSVPEPSSLTMVLSLGALALLGYAWRRKGRNGRA
jgi:hypothetical protein